MVGGEEGGWGARTKLPRIGCLSKEFADPVVVVVMIQSLLMKVIQGGILNNSLVIIFMNVVFLT